MKNYYNFLNENNDLKELLSDKTLTGKDDAFFRKYIDLDIDYFTEYKYDKDSDEITIKLENDWFEDFYNIDVAYLSQFIDLNSQYPYYEYEVDDEIYHYFDDDNHKIFNNILEIFNMTEDNYYFVYLCSLSKPTSLSLYNIRGEISMVHRQAIINDAGKMWDKLPFYFESLDESHLKISIKLDDIKTTVDDLLQKTPMLDLEHFVYTTNVEDDDYEEMNEEIKKPLNDIYEYFKENKDNILSEIPNKTHQLYRYKEMGGDFLEKIERYNFQEEIFSKSNDNLKTYKELESLNLLNPKIISKYGYLIKVEDFNL